MSGRPRISVLVPVYNEETNIQPFYNALGASIAGFDVDFELIFVDDGSSDQTFHLIGELARRDRRVKALRFSRNFGSHAALTAGLRYAGGDAAIMISADLQDPPDLIGLFIERWQQGYHVVWGVRERRDDPWLKKTLAHLFYRFLRRVALRNYPLHGMDCGLLDRQVVDALKHFHEINRVLPTLVVWAGFRQTQVPYHRRARHTGSSKWSLGQRIKAAIDVITSFSYLPIRSMSYLGLIVSLLGFIYAIFLIVRPVFFGLGSPEWSLVLVAILLLGGVQLLMLGVVGEYIWRISEQGRGRPLYIIMEQIGFETTKPTTENQ
jgi:dolichol-phosphate mannosyltransferase